jgi:hypothetical protein
MSILPNGGGLDPKTPIEDRPQPSKTYRLDLKTGRIVGMVDGIEALKQSVRQILSTPRYQHQIYSHNYGIELEGIVGSDRLIIQSKLKQRIQDALLVDDRIKAVEKFDFAFESDSVTVTFSVISTLGNFKEHFNMKQ